MNSIAEQRLSQLVDREGEISNFCKMLDNPDWPKPITLIWGEGGIGKSSLLFRMIHECSARNFVKAEVFWTDIYNHDYLAVMRKIRDDLGADKFSEFTKLVNYFFADQPIKLELTAKAPITVGQGMIMAEGATVQQIAGVVIEPTIVVKDKMETTPRNDLAINDSDRMARITSQFLENLNAVAKAGRVIVFLDAIEKATEMTQKWLWYGLLDSLQHGQLSNVQFVICGRNQPIIDERWRLLVEEERLAPLNQQDISDFLDRLQIHLDAAARKPVVDTIWVASQGNPLKMATYAGELSRMWKNRRT
jgi:GTPase SAR1 family protein